MRNSNEEILNFNKGRSTDMLKFKFKTMCDSAFVFYRGTAHLFYQDLPADSPILKAPPVWVCGDLHLENYGSFKGDNRVAYFDINDFDESTLTSALIDASRLITSVYVAADFLKINKEEADNLTRHFLDIYGHNLEHGYIRHLEQESAEGIIKKFLKQVQKRKQNEFVSSRVEHRNHKLHLIIDKVKTLPVPKEIKQQVNKVMVEWAENKDDPKYFRIQDIAYRVAGTGSLGAERYILLVEGKGKSNNLLLDLKEALPSAVETFLKTPPYPQFDTEAKRVEELQKRIQPVPPALLSTIALNNKSFVLRELQPTSDKMNLALIAGKPKKLAELLEPMAQTLAWGQLRSGGRQGSASADTLIELGKNKNEWKKNVLDFAKDYAVKVKADYKNYLKAYNKGYFD